MRTYTDHELEHWGRVFTASGLRASRGVTFERFLHAPHVYISDARATVLAREEAAATDALQSEAPEARIADGQWREPLHHRAHPRRRGVFWRRSA